MGLSSAPEPRVRKGAEMPSIHSGPSEQGASRSGRPLRRVRSKPSRGQCLAQVMLLVPDLIRTLPPAPKTKIRRRPGLSSVTYLDLLCEQLGKPKKPPLLTLFPTFP